jgi:hypothetical protein
LGGSGFWGAITPADIGRDPSRLILAEQLGRRAPPRLVLEIDIRKLLPALSITTKQASLSSSIDQGGGKRPFRAGAALVFAK